MLGAMLMTFSGQAIGAEAARAPFGKISTGEAIEAITLKNKNGVSASIITYGATLQSLIAPGRDGKMADIALGFKDAAAYEKNASYFGASVGRYANRIGKGKFTIDGKSYQLALNDNGVAALHGGPKGFDKRVWKVLDVKSGPVASVTFGYTSPDGEEGYPGTLTVTATYSLDENNQLTIDYRAKTDKPTIVNLTNHALFNMAGEGSPEGAMGNVLTIPADYITPVDAELIPTGELRPVEGTPFDFRKPRVVGKDIRDASDPQIVVGRGYDHNFVLNGKSSGDEMHLAGRLEDPASGRVLEVLTNQPGVQFYAGNFIDGTMIGKSNHIYRQGDGIALEPQVFPDSPNKPNFPNARLNPGQEYHHKMAFRLTTSAR
ncbi:galactose mutarotase [Sphingosinicellaceae bacterium A1X5R2]|nr:aldose epimerase family protein [Pedomonas mirosovicensis]MCH8686793.1 galactose mutarotase [Pedomonas mirosovicensis]